MDDDVGHQGDLPAALALLIQGYAQREAAWKALPVEDRSRYAFWVAQGKTEKGRRSRALTVLDRVEQGQGWVGPVRGLAFAGAGLGSGLGEVFKRGGAPIAQSSWASSASAAKRFVGTRVVSIIHHPSYYIIGSNGTVVTSGTTYRTVPAYRQR